MVWLGLGHSRRSDAPRRCDRAVLGARLSPLFEPVAVVGRLVRATTSQRFQVPRAWSRRPWLEGAFRLASPGSEVARRSHTSERIVRRLDSFQRDVDAHRLAMDGFVGHVNGVAQLRNNLARERT